MQPSLYLTIRLGMEDESSEVVWKGIKLLMALLPLPGKMGIPTRLVPVNLTILCMAAVYF